MIVLLFACGAAPTVPEAPREKRDPDVLGAWTSECVPDRGGSYSDALRFAPDDWTLTRSRFSDSGCATPYYTEHIEGPYTVTKKSEAIPGAWEVELGLTEKTLQPQTDAALDYLKTSCPEEITFLAGQTTAILEKGCAVLGEKPITQCFSRYDVVSVVDDRLQLGKSAPDVDNCSPAGRPTSLGASFARGR
jgi:hypothetical protein